MSKRDFRQRATVKRSVRWDGRTGVRGYRVADPPTIITVTVQTGSDTLRREANRLIDAELSAMLKSFGK